MDALKKLEGLQNAEAFEQEMAAVNSVEEMQKLLSKHGIEMSAEEIESLAQYANKAEGELNEDALDDVAGGVRWTSKTKTILKHIGRTIVILVAARKR